MLKTIFDYLGAFFLLLLLLFPMLLIWLICTIDTGQNGLFLHSRIGQAGRPFKMFKFRTLKGDYTNAVTTESTHMFSKSGRFLMRWKLDELPQLINILNGTMSFVGPRPDVAGYADELEGDDRIILQIKPGITGPAQLKYKNESGLLADAEDPIYLNNHVLWWDKVKINKEYVRNQSFLGDLVIIWRTLRG